MKKPLSSSFSTPVKSKNTLEIYIRPWHDEHGNEIALVVHGSGTYVAKDMLLSFSVAGTFFDKEAIVRILNNFNITDFEKDAKFFHSKGPRGGFWIFSSFQNTMLETVLENKGKYENLLENFQNFFNNDTQPWIVKVAPPMVLTKENEAMWAVYAEVSRKIQVTNIEKLKKAKMNNLTITPTSTTTVVVEDEENY
jgi:hypothetical protein